MFLKRMETSLSKLIDINASGLVLMACNAHDIWDPAHIEKNKIWVVDRIIEQMKHDEVGVEALSKIMDEKIALLNQHLDKGEELPEPLREHKEEEPKEFEDYQRQAKAEELKEYSDYHTPKKQADEPSPLEQKKEEAKQPNKSKVKSTDMPTKLAHERKPLKKLILEDCVQLGLISKDRAEYVVTQMAGKQPADAEKEVVVELRDNLHKQVRKLIRKDKDNPWSSPKAQEELRLEITQTPTVRSVLFLTKDIYRERGEWLKRSHNSITGRIFGSKMALDKNK